ncbi:MAG: discoidin domain-containing protein [Ignavibacteriales bacterium]|nr:discoidin domain-containing protein [Ignavibacteriales bacterium]
MTKTVFLSATLCLHCILQITSAQSRIPFNNQQLFLSGSNIAWVRFAGDLGPGTLDTARFRNVFDAISANGGNCMRLWLHTDGTQTPEFDANGRVTGPGLKAVTHLKKILDMSWERKIGLILCLWSFDMHRWSLDSATLQRNTLLLTDPQYTRSYIDNALIPLVSGVKGHPAIVAWEVFNEAEGMTDEFGWYGIKLVPISNIQRFVNLAAGAIHRTDPSAQVTTGTWAMTVSTDVNLLPNQDDPLQRRVSITEQEKEAIEREFTLRHNVSMPAEEILSRLSAENFNYYRDDRLITAGGDPDGTLDFYSNHYYAYQGIVLSPFHVPCSYWELTKPLVIAEFFPENILGLPFGNLYRTLYNNGYAGALSWGWNQSTWRSNTLALVKDIFNQYPHAIAIVFQTGTIIAFTSLPSVIEKGKSAKLFWATSIGSSVTLDGRSVDETDSTVVTPSSTTTYTLVARGNIESTKETTVEVLPTGTIVFLKADPIVIGRGESSILSWHSVEGSSGTLNGKSVLSSDSTTVTLQNDSTFTLIATGETSDTASITIRADDPALVNRALLRPASASSGDQGTNFENPGLAVDGNISTRWSSEYSDDQWILLDLGKQFEIHRVVLRWETAYGRSYSIETSADATNWREIFGTSSGDGGVDDMAGLSGTGRYVRMRGRDRATEWGYSLWENPFNPSTEIRYQISEVGHVSMKVFDALGREVAALVDEVQEAGIHKVKFTASNLSGGIYLTRLQSGKNVQMKKMVFVK